jgi:hypothetical protein
MISKIRGKGNRLLSNKMRSIQAPSPYEGKPDYYDLMADYISLNASFKAASHRIDELYKEIKELKQ